VKDPNQSLAEAALGMLRLKQKNEPEARTLLQKAIELESKNFLINYYYAIALQNADKATMRAQLNKSIEAAPRFVAPYGLLASANLATGENLGEAETLLKKALAIAPGREDLRVMLAQVYLKANRSADGMALLTNLRQVSTNPDIKQKSIALLDELAPTQAVFTEIRPEDLPAPRQARQAEPEIPAIPAPQPSARETKIESLVPTGPNVSGEKVTGMLTAMDCANGLTLRLRTDKGNLEFHSSNPAAIQFLSYTSKVSNNIQCGPQNPPAPIQVTYRPQGAGGEPLVVEFLEVTK
jgi:tetratricopeptide (TPR) repeat protein